MKILNSFFEKLSNKKIVTIFIFIGFMVFANSFFNNFEGDDFMWIRDNPYIRSVINIPKLFTKGSDFATTPVDIKSNYYRPIHSTALSLIYSLSHDNPFGFHLVSISFHIINALLIYYVIKFIFEKKTAILLALIFLIHPINSEAVTGASFLQDILFVLFGLLSIVLVIRNQKYLYRGLLGFLLLFSLLSKETGFLFLIIIPTFCFLYRRQFFVKSLIQSFIALMVYIFFRFGIAHIYFPQNPIAPIMVLPFLERVINIPKIIFFYFKTFIFPKDLLFYQVWTVKILNLANFYLPLLVEILLCIIFILFAIKVRKNNKNLYKTLLFFSLWFIMGLGFHLQIIPLDQTVADRYFYFPIIGLLGIIGVIVNYYHINEQLKITSALLFIMVIVIFSARVIMRNRDRRTPFILYTHDIRYNTDSYLLESSLGAEYVHKNDNKEAEKHYINAVTLFPEKKTYSILGVFYFSENNFEEAKKAFENALIYDPNDPKARLLFGITEYNLGNKQEALTNIYNSYLRFPNSTTLKILRLVESGTTPRLNIIIK